MRAEDVEVFGAEEVGVADFDGVLPIGWELREEGVERCEEIAQAGEMGGMKGGELEDEDAGFLAMRGEGAEEGVEEERGVEEVGVVRSGAVAETFEAREFFHRDFVGDFEAQAEVIRDLRAEVGQVFLRREAVVAGVNADRGENFGVFLEALGLEAFVREFAAREVALLVVDLSEPALVFPRGGAEEEVAFPREAGRLAGECRGERAGS